MCSRMSPCLMISKSCGGCCFLRTQLRVERLTLQCSHGKSFNATSGRLCGRYELAVLPGSAHGHKPRAFEAESPSGTSSCCFCTRGSPESCFQELEAKLRDWPYASQLQEEGSILKTCFFGVGLASSAGALCRRPRWLALKLPGQTHASSIASNPKRTSQGSLAHAMDVTAVRHGAFTLLRYPNVRRWMEHLRSLLGSSNFKLSFQLLLSATFFPNSTKGALLPGFLARSWAS